MRHEHKVREGRYARANRATGESWYLAVAGGGFAAEAHLDPANRAATVHTYASDGPLMAHEGTSSTPMAELLEMDEDAVWAHLDGLLR